MRQCGSMKRETALLAIAMTAILGMACGSGSPAAPSPQPNPTPSTPPAPAPPPAPLTDQQFKDRLEALMLGSGPRSDPGNPGCVTPGRHIRWAESLQTMRLVMSSKTRGRERDQLRDVFETYRQILGGRPVLQEEIVDVVPPMPTLVAAPQVGMIAVDVVEDGRPFCGNTLAGCASAGGPDWTYSLGSILLRPDSPDGTAAHEAGHVIGMCHVIGVGGGASIMGAGGATSPTALDREVLEKVLHSGLRPGATRADFVAKGLL
jgi:hypothetical protein